MKNIEEIETKEVLGITIPKGKKIKLSEEENKFIIRSAARIKRRCIKKYNLRESDANVIDYIGEARRRLMLNKLTKSRVLSFDNKKKVRPFIKKEFGLNNLDTLVKKVAIDSIEPDNQIQRIIKVLAVAELQTRTNVEFFKGKHV